MGPILGPYKSFVMPFSLFLPMAMMGMATAGMSSAMQGANNIEAMKLQQKYNQQNAAKQQEYTLANMAQADIYQRNILRDSPQINANAMRAAGQSIAGLGESFSPAQSNVANTQGAGANVSMPSFGMPDFTGGIAQLAKLYSEVRNIEADTNMKQSQESLNNENRELVEEQAKLTTILQSKQYNLSENIAQDTTNKIKELEVMDADIKLKAQQAFNQYSQADIAYSQLDLQTKAVAADIELKHTQGLLNDAQARMSYKAISKMSAEIDNLEALKMVNDEQAQVLRAQAYNVKTDADIKAYELAVKNFVGVETQGDYQKKYLQQHLDVMSSQMWLNRANAVEAGTKSAKNVAETIESGTRSFNNIKKNFTPAGIIGFN